MAPLARHSLLGAGSGPLRAFPAFPDGHGACSRELQEAIMGSVGSWKMRIVAFAVGVAAGVLCWFSIRAEGNLARRHQELAPVSCAPSPIDQRPV